MARWDLPAGVRNQLNVNTSGGVEGGADTNSREEEEEPGLKGRLGADESVHLAGDTCVRSAGGFIPSVG